MKKKINKNSYLEQGHCRIAELPSHSSSPKERLSSVTVGRTFQERGWNNGKGKMGRKFCRVPRQGDGAGGMCSQEPEVGWGSRGFCQFCGLRAHAEQNCSLCPAVSHPAVLSLRVWDMLTWG